MFACVWKRQKVCRLWIYFSVSFNLGKILQQHIYLYGNELIDAVTESISVHMCAFTRCIIWGELYSILVLIDFIWGLFLKGYISVFIIWDVQTYVTHSPLTTSNVSVFHFLVPNNGGHKMHMQIEIWTEMHIYKRHKYSEGSFESIWPLCHAMVYFKVIFHDEIQKPTLLLPHAKWINMHARNRQH